MAPAANRRGPGNRAPTRKPPSYWPAEMVEALNVDDAAAPDSVAVEMFDKSGPVTLSAQEAALASADEANMGLDNPDEEDSMLDDDASFTPSCRVARTYSRFLFVAFVGLLVVYGKMSADESNE